MPELSFLLVCLGAAYLGAFAPPPEEISRWASASLSALEEWIVSTVGYILACFCVALALLVAVSGERTSPAPLSGGTASGLLSSPGPGVASTS